jgi:peptide/nickel transport system permease protein
MPVLLWTDILIFLLVIGALAFALHARRHEHLRAPWRQVTRSRTAMSALVVLAIYIVIGLLDSMHFHPRLPGDGEQSGGEHSTEILSVFDWLATPLRETDEKTYSAPFATHLFVKETVKSADGHQARKYPRLVHAGRHLDDPQADRAGDIAVRTALGVAKGLLAWLTLAMALVALRARACRQSLGQSLEAVARARTKVRWRAMLASTAICLALAFVLAELAGVYHVLGTDKVGEDVFYQTLKSVRTGLVIGTLTTLVMLPFAIALGIMAGYFRGWVDDVIQYVYTTLNSIPSVLLIAAAVLILQVYLDANAASFSSAVERADLRLLFLCLILGVTSWTGLCRYLRAESLKIREVDFVQAASALGVTHAGIIVKHILPNVMHIVLITVVLDFSALVLAEAVLSYVQIGVDPTMNSWGNMINSARLEMAREPVVWWSLAAAFLFMFTLVLAANLFADAVRDAFDPRLRQ